ncbi:DNA cytosine methyltransferase [Verrucomicrobia bacterium]|nr:DNA cytosine methyltransferase [Verrucomicrobiota bacterium]
MFANVGFSTVDRDNVVLATELLPERCSFHEQVNPGVPVIQGDISDAEVKAAVIRKSKQSGVTDILATPPCQGMSSQNGKRKLNDPRNLLIVDLMEVFNGIRPETMMIENVEEMAKTTIKVKGKQINIVDYIKAQLPKDYHLRQNICDAADYGTAQHRRRLIILISRIGVWEHPRPHGKFVTVNESIGHLPALESGEFSSIPWHHVRKYDPMHVRVMSHTPTGNTAMDNAVHFPKKKNGKKVSAFATAYKRNWDDRPAYTIHSNSNAPSSQNNIHPGTKQANGTYNNARCFTVRELLVLCGLPENLLDKFAVKLADGTFKFVLDPKTENHLGPRKCREKFIRTVIGEMFPPKFAAAMYTTAPSSPSPSSKTTADGSVLFLGNGDGVYPLPRPSIKEKDISGNGQDSVTDGLNQPSCPVTNYPYASGKRIQPIAQAKAGAYSATMPTELIFINIADQVRPVTPGAQGPQIIRMKNVARTHRPGGKKGTGRDYLEITKLGKSGIVREIVRKSDGLNPSTPHFIEAIHDNTREPKGLPKTKNGRLKKGAFVRHIKETYRAMKEKFDPAPGRNWKGIKAKFLDSAVICKAEIRLRGKIGGTDTVGVPVQSKTVTDAGDDQLDLFLDNQAKGNPKAATQLGGEFELSLSKIEVNVLQLMDNYNRQVAKLPYHERLVAVNLGHHGRNKFVQNILNKRPKN